jgi:hypothetical protein
VDKKQKVLTPLEQEVKPQEAQPEPNPLDLKKLLTAQDFQLGATQRFLRLPNGLPKNK